MVIVVCAHGFTEAGIRNQCLLLRLHLLLHAMPGGPESRQVYDFFIENHANDEVRQLAMEVREACRNRLQ